MTLNNFDSSKFHEKDPEDFKYCDCFILCVQFGTFYNVKRTYAMHARTQWPLLAVYYIACFEGGAM